MSQYLKTSPPGIKTKNYEFDGDHFNITKIKGDKFGLVGVLFMNKEKSITLNTKFDLKKLTNMEVLCPISTNAFSVDIAVPPNSERMMILKSNVFDQSNTAYAYEYNESYRLQANFTEQELKNICRLKGKQGVMFNGQVEVYSTKYLGGFADLYVNNSPN
mmetsp:Transcript_16588/g.14425  ORF Transcript_16588/g.14425 Transcript_16588/m.14425 type:complete len:160 (+) Transcript_16588:2520-2999(+)